MAAQSPSHRPPTLSDKGLNLGGLFSDCARLVGERRRARLEEIWLHRKKDPTPQLRELLGSLSSGRYLVFLDNLEDVLDDGGRIAPSGIRRFFELNLTSASHTQFLVASRIPLAFAAEVNQFNRRIVLDEGLDVRAGT